MLALRTIEFQLKLQHNYRTGSVVFVRLRVTDYLSIIPILSMSPSNVHSEIAVRLPSNRTTSLTALHQVVIKIKMRLVFLKIGGNK